MFSLSVPWWELVIRGAVVFAFLIVFLRATGSRQVGQLSPLDLILLLILSNAVQNAMNGGDNSLLGGLISATTLITLNWLLSYISYRSPGLEKFIDGEAVVLVRDGKIAKDVLDRQKITLAELDQALRLSGTFNISDVKLAILETNGHVSVCTDASGDAKPNAPVAA